PRFHVFSGVAALAVALMAAAAARPGAQTARISPKTRQTWAPSRTPDGQPNVQGYWTNATFTPLERPKALGTKEFYTETEAAAVEKQRLLEENNQSPDDVHYDNVLWQGESYRRTVSN